MQHHFNTDIAKQYDYRKFYKDYYGIKFTAEYDIHHIDFNRDNNNIDNLILLPKKLHAKYHMCINSLGCDKNGIIQLNILIGLNYDNSYKNKMLKVYIHTLEEIKEWVLYKNKLQIQKDNRRFNNGSI